MREHDQHSRDDRLITVPQEIDRGQGTQPCSTIPASKEDSRDGRCHLPSSLLGESILDVAGGRTRVQQQQAVVMSATSRLCALDAYDGPGMTLVLEVQWQSSCSIECQLKAQKNPATWSF